MTERSVLAVGEVLWDLLPSGPRLGGTNANFAVACARLGHAAALVSCVGDDPLGEEARRTLATQSAGTAFDASLVQTTTAVPTGTVSVSLGPGGQPQYGISTPAAWDRIAATSEALAAAGAADALCFGTLAQREEPSRTAIRTLVAAATNAVRVFDVNVRPPFCTAETVQWSLAHADLVKISEEELGLVLAMMNGSRLAASAPEGASPESVWSREALEAAARSVLAYAPACRLVAVTLGSRGSLLVTRQAADRHTGFATTVKDTVGAGDAFTAGMTTRICGEARSPPSTPSATCAAATSLRSRAQCRSTPARCWKASRPPWGNRSAASRANALELRATRTLPFDFLQSGPPKNCHPERSEGPAVP